MHRHLRQLVLQGEHVYEFAMLSQDPAERFLYDLLVMSLFSLAFVEYCQCVDAVFDHLHLLGVHCEVGIVSTGYVTDANTSYWIYRCRVAAFLAAAIEEEGANPFPTLPLEGLRARSGRQLGDRFIG